MQSYIKASNPDENDLFGGYGVGLSEDASVLVVGAYCEDSGANGVNGDQADNSSAECAGAAYVFVRDQQSWQQQAYLKAPNPEASDAFGQSVAVSGDGLTIAVGATNESSGAIGIGGEQDNNAVPEAGAVYLY